MTTLSRRGFVASGVCAAAVCGSVNAIAGLGASAAGSDKTGPSGLDAVARSNGMRFGSAVGSRGPLLSCGDRNGDPICDPAYVKILKENCSILVAENEHKLYTLMPNKGDLRFERGDAIVDFADREGMATRGHTLLWNRTEFTPGWLNDEGFASAASAEKFLRDYIASVCSHYGPRIYEWDVVNETVDEDSGKLRETVFSKALGERLFDVVFGAAKEAAPHAALAYNDYMNWEKYYDKHRAGVLNLLESFRKKGVPVKTLGVQGHIGVNAGDPVDGFSKSADENAWRKFLEEVESMGYDVVVTEFDVNDTNLVADPAKRDAEIAAYAKGWLDITLSFRNVRDVVAWGIVDKYSWLREWWPRADGLAKRPTPFDDQFKPKPLYDAMATAFAAAPLR